MPSILIAYPVDHSSLILGKQNIVFYCSSSEVFTADKLCMEVGNTVTLFMDPQLDSYFMENIFNDLQCLYSLEIQTTNQQVVM